MKFVVYPYSMGSNSARDLAQALNAKRVFPDGNYRPDHNHVVINWGYARQPNWDGDIPAKFLNPPGYITVSRNKLNSLEVLQENGVRVPPFTTDYDEAVGWDKPFVARWELQGHSGSGAQYCEGEERHGNFSNCPLFTRYIRRNAEFRVHVLDGEVIDFAQRKRSRSVDDVDWRIRSRPNGWIMAREDVTLPESVREAALLATKAINLDFGAVDVLHTASDKAYVLEVNSAPGLEGTTLESYCDAFLTYLRGLEQLSSPD